MADLTLTLTLEGDPANLAAALVKIASGLSAEKTLSPQAPDGSGAVSADAAAMDRLLSEIIPEARVAMRWIANHAPEVSFKDAQAGVGPLIGYSSGMDGQMLAGKLASIGFAVGRTNVPNPIKRDYRRAQYIMDPADAALVEQRFTARYDDSGKPLSPS